MLKKTDNYEEAKAILQHVPDDDYTAAYRKACTLRGLIWLGGGLAVSFVLGLVMKKHFLTLATLPGVGVVTLAAFLPLFYYNAAINKLKTEVYYARLPEYIVIEKANEYADNYNSFKRKEQQRK